MDIAQYRARIGLFYGALKCRSVPWRPQTLCMRAQCVLLAAMAIVLMLGGDIEANPGPPKNDPFQLFRSSSTADLASTSTQDYNNMATGLTMSGFENVSATMDHKNFESKSTDSKLDTLLSEIRSVNKTVHDIKTDINSWRKSVDEKITGLDKNQTQLQQENVRLKGAVDQLRNKVNELENSHRAKNLIISGIESDPNVIAKDSVRMFLADSLQIDNASDIPIEHAIKLTDTLILAKFGDLEDRNRILEFARRNPSQNWRIKPDICREWHEARKKLAHIYQKAKTERRNVMMRKDVLIVDGEHITYDPTTETINRFTPTQNQDTR